MITATLGRTTLQEVWSRQYCIVRCRTLEEAQTLFQALENMWATWADGDPYDAKRTFWSRYRDNTCYSTRGTMGSLVLYENTHRLEWEIIDFKDIDMSSYLFFEFSDDAEKGDDKK